MKKSLLLLSFCFLFLHFTMAQTTITLQPDATAGKDAVVYSYSPDSNHGDRESNTVYTWTNQGNLALKRFFLAFDFSTIPSGADILEAKLSLYYNPTDPYESFEFHEGDNTAFIKRVTANWEENSITWNNQPSVTNDGQVSLARSTTPTQDYLDIDVTKLVSAMNNPANDNYGFMVQLKDEINFYKSLLLASSDHPNNNLHPKLTITYSTAQQTCTTLQPDAEEGRDAVVYSYSPDSNHGDRESNTVYTWTNQGNLALKRFFLAFDLSFLPSDAVITSAGLSLYYNSTDPYESFEFHEGDNTAFIKRVTADWEENSITWNNQPNVSTNNQVYLPASTSPKQNYLDIDVRALVADMNILGNHGFRIQLEDEVNFYKSLLFASSDHPNSALHPALQVCWTSETNSVDNFDPAFLDFQLFPNPTNGTFQISLQGDQEIAYSVNIYNTLGQLVKSYSKHLETMNLEKAGIYFVHIVNKKGNGITRKIVVE